MFKLRQWLNTATPKTGALKRKQTFPAQTIKVSIPRNNMKIDQNFIGIALELGDIDEEEFLMFCHVNRTYHLDIPYWKYEIVVWIT